MNQQLAQQGMVNRSKIDVQDESNRINQLGALPGLENQAIAPDLDKQKTILNARQSDIQMRNNLVMNKYNQDMQAWAAAQQANATANSGKK
jgi:hypothetical protein